MEGSTCFCIVVIGCLLIFMGNTIGDLKRRVAVLEVSQVQTTLEVCHEHISPTR